MAWFRVDDKLHDHPKVRKLRSHKMACLGLWTACGSWSSDTLSDGFVPTEIVHRFDPDESLAKRLVEVGLWVQHEHDGEDGYLFHQWTEHQPTKADVERRREEARERMRRRRAKPGGQPVSSSQDVRANSQRTSSNAFAHDDANDLGGDPAPDDYSSDDDGLFKDPQVSDPVRANRERTSAEVPHPDPARPIVPNGTKKTPRKRGARQATPEQQAAHAITKAYAERIGPMVNFPAVLGIVGKAVKGGHSADAIESALDRLNEAGRPVTTETLRIELDRRAHLRAVSGGYQPYRNPVDDSVYDEPM